MSGPELLGDGWVEALAESLGDLAVPGAASGTVQVTVNAIPGRPPTAFVAVVADGRLSVRPGREKDADAQIDWRYEDFVLVWAGETSLEASYMAGQAKVDGNRVLLIDGWRPMMDAPELRAALRGLGAGNS